MEFQNRIYILGRDESGARAKEGEIKSVGLDDQPAVVTRGPLPGTCIAAAVDEVPNLHLLREAEGAVTNVGRFDVGAGSTNIPLAIAVRP